MRSTISAILVLLTITASGQNLETFSYSDCMHECINDSSKITEISKTGGVTLIKVKTYAPCNGNLAGGVKYLGKNLNLMFWTKPIMIKQKDGTVAELIEVADCNCLFNFTYEILKLKNAVAPASILVNGHTLQEINARNILIEMAIDK